MPSLTLGTLNSGSAAGQRLVLSSAAIQKHLHIQGISGYGKSSFLASLFLQLANQGIGVALIDPSSDLGTDLLAYLIARGYFERPDAFDRLWYVMFSNDAYFLPFNPLAQPYPDHVVVRNLLETFKRAWPSLSEGAPQFENIVLASSLVLLQAHEPITALPRLLTERDYRESLLSSKVSDPLVLDFFRTRFPQQMTGGAAAIESTLRRLFLLQFSPALRFSLGQPQGFPFRRVLDEGICCIFDLGGLDADSQRLIGSLLAIGFEQAALARADTPSANRPPYHLLIDEFSLFSATSEESLARVLDLCRKENVFLVLANQTTSQLPKRIHGALQNAVKIAFRIGVDDAASIAPYFFDYDPKLTKRSPTGSVVALSEHEQLAALRRELQRLPPRTALVRLGEATQRIITLTIPHAPVSERQLQAVLDTYAHKLLTPRAWIEARQPSGQPPPPPALQPAYPKLFQHKRQTP